MTQGNDKTDFRRKNQDKHIEDNFPALQFQNAFQIGPFQGLSRSKRDSREAFFWSGHPNSGKYYKAISKLNMQTFAPGFSDRKSKQTGNKYSAVLRFE